MLHKIKIFGGGILLLLGLGLAIGYPDGGVINVVKYSPTNKNNIPTLNKKGNEKNFLSNGKTVNKSFEKTIHTISHTKQSIKKKTVSPHTIQSVNAEQKKQIKKVKKVVPKPIKKKIKLVAPPPTPEEEEEDEGC